MAWNTNQPKLKWNKVNLSKVNGSVKPTLGEAKKALELSAEKVKVARAALETLFDGKTFPKLPAGKVLRLSIKLDRGGEIAVMAAAADVAESDGGSEEFAW